MADKSKKNFFQRMGQTFKEVRQELKKAVWPSKEKLKNTSAVVLVVILFFAIFLGVISSGGRWILEKINFYDEVEPTYTTAATEVVAATEATTIAETEAAVEETEAVEETTVESEA
ncbi:MAG: preprotein translocase subunit SecE [Saccharofermentans sp.]|nr:preprotein translocase subunit SecE [Saccharofermentans sp.]